MPAMRLTLKKRSIHLQKCIVAPHFGERTILTNDNWDYVELWLRRHRHSRAYIYWRQARAFYQATKHLTKLTTPLTSYYAALNATHALLEAKGVTPSSHHGITGNSLGNKVSLKNEVVNVGGSGVLPELCKYLGEHAGGEQYSLRDVFYNLVYLHRAYCITFKSAKELFVPISDPHFRRKPKSDECWFQCCVEDKHFQTKSVVASLTGMERDLGDSTRFWIRAKRRFRWEHGGVRTDNLEKLRKEHQKIRERTRYICGLTRLWYYKRDVSALGLIDRSSLTLTFMAFHRLSEIARYDAPLLERHFSSQHNWLLAQFLERGLDQFIDEISAEITGMDFMLPGYTTTR